MLAAVAIASPSLMSANETAHTHLNNATIATENGQLHSHDGTVSMTGGLRSYTEGRYELKAALGVLLVSANMVWCEGAGCPEPIETNYAPNVGKG